MEVKVSVIVPTLNRCALLERLLRSLFEQTLSQDLFEILVASDGCADGTVNLVQMLQKDHKNLRLLEQGRRGPAAARNTAARIAKGEYLAFTDDDCVAPKQWLENLVKGFIETGAAGIQGRTSTIEAECSPLTNEVRNEKGMSGVPTCNAAYRKDIFQRVGGFDESFSFPHNEDADLAWRIEKLAPIRFLREVHMIHPPRRETLCRRAHWVRYLETEFLLFAKHPEAYRRHSSSPWRTIYGHVFVIAAFFGLKSAIKYLFPPFRPRYFMEAIALVLVREWNLLRFYPHYRKAAMRHRGLQVEPWTQPKPTHTGSLAER
jgi:glycosyltransferase involved in cell wall biosynthesis